MIKIVFIYDLHYYYDSPIIQLKVIHSVGYELMTDSGTMWDNRIIDGFSHKITVRLK